MEELIREERVSEFVNFNGTKWYIYLFPELKKKTEEQHEYNN